MQESVKCLVSQENHPGLAESTVDVGLVAVVEDLDGGKRWSGERLSPHELSATVFGCCIWEKHPNWEAADRERHIHAVRDQRKKHDKTDRGK